jgi:hypothetical protein
MRPVRWFLSETAEYRTRQSGQRSTPGPRSSRAAAFVFASICLLCCLLLSGSRAFALEFFGDVLYWQATETVDWTMNTSGPSTNQTVAFRTLDFDFNPGFRVGVGTGSAAEGGITFSYTRFYTDTEDWVSGNVTPIFLGNRMATSLLRSPHYFDDATVHAAIDYNVLDLDFGKSFQPTESLRLRPVLGLRGAWINQSIDTEFRYIKTNVLERLTSDEHIKNDFWGIGPRLGIENSLSLWSGEQCRIDLTLNFYAAYLLGYWSISDVTTNATILLDSPYYVPVANRNFGALTFQAMAGVNFSFGHWSATAGYEINDWLNQCQIFDDATGPHNNDLIVQGLSARVSYSF